MNSRHPIEDPALLRFDKSQFGWAHFAELPKDWLRIDPDQVMVAGFSNSADFAHQVHIMYGDKVAKQLPTHADVILFVANVF